MIKITHKRQECIGCGVCSAECPTLFETKEEDGLVMLKNSHLNQDGIFEIEIEAMPCSEDILKCCPLDLIKIEEI